MHNQYLNRDLSWLSFNGRVLEEAACLSVPLIERIKFLSIFSSNLDEFYRVRMPAMMLLHKAGNTSDEHTDVALQQARHLIQQQQEAFGKLLRDTLLPALKQEGIVLLYNEMIPPAIEAELTKYFQSEVMAFLRIQLLDEKADSFFLKSNALYKAVVLETQEKQEHIFLVSIPSDKIPRFLSVIDNDKQYIVFLEDIIKLNLDFLFPGATISGSYNIKLTRDAELELADEYDGDLAAKIEHQLAKRDDGDATRFLYEPGMALRHLHWLMTALKVAESNAVEGGHYHNLKDLGAIPVKRATLAYTAQPSLSAGFETVSSIFEAMQERDNIIHTPYQSYYSILRFFNEAAVNSDVEEIYTTLYRVAGDSRIVNALITAATNGKKVTVFIELKARFDEENNIRWSKQMKEAGIKIINSIPALKVHAKVALVKKKQHGRVQYFGLLATGNLNETTARFYTDHILLTCHAGIVRDLELLFIFLTFRRKPADSKEIRFQHLLIAQFNLRQKFIDLIDREISNHQQGKPSGIMIKMNNLEEKVLINKLYEAAAAGVKVQLIVRSICCLDAGVSSNISVIRIVDRYLEHGRVFIFTNAGNHDVFMGSADWMNRNIYRRIEVCFPLYDAVLKQQMMDIIHLQLKDNVQAVKITAALDNEPVVNDEKPIQSQVAIYQYLQYQTPLQ